jgi:hypothetical protein
MIDSGLLERVLVAVVPKLDYDALLRHLRGEFPGIHITVCGEDDIPPRLPAVAENEACLLYYVDASEHCLKLTNDAEAASGIAVALRGDD